MEVVSIFLVLFFFFFLYFYFRFLFFGKLRELEFLSTTSDGTHTLTENILLIIQDSRDLPNLIKNTIREKKHKNEK